MNDPYIDELRNDFEGYSSQLKKLRKRLLKTESPEMQSKIVRQIDSIAGKMENNQKRMAKITKSRTKQRKAKSKR